jgi:hypothetical protein
MFSQVVPIGLACPVGEFIGERMWQFNKIARRGPSEACAVPTMH